MIFKKKMTRLISSLIVVIIVIFSGSCAIYRNDVVVFNPSSHPVYLTATGYDDKDYGEIGFIHVSAPARMGYDELNERLRQKAQSIGADAVIHVMYSIENAFSVSLIFISIPYDVLTAEGLAVVTYGDYK